MFDSLKAMGAVASLMKNKEALAEAFARVSNELDEREITVESKGPDGKPGISVTVSGTLKVRSIDISPAMLKSLGGDSEKLGKLIAKATNTALERAKKVIGEEVSKEAKKMGLPELPGIKELLGG